MWRHVVLQSSDLTIYNKMANPRILAPARPIAPTWTFEAADEPDAPALVAAALEALETLLDAEDAKDEAWLTRLETAPEPAAVADV